MAPPFARSTIRKRRPPRLWTRIVFSTVVYEDQTLPAYTTERLSERALVAILYYGYGGLFISNERKTPYLPNIVLAWRYFVSNEATRKMSIERNPLLAANTVAVGYAKMDRLATIPRQTGSRKTILLCPHHTLDRVPGELALSTFLKNADLFQRLPVCQSFSPKLRLCSVRIRCSFRALRRRNGGGRNGPPPTSVRWRRIRT